MVRILCPMIGSAGIGNRFKLLKNVGFHCMKLLHFKEKNHAIACQKCNVLFFMSPRAVNSLSTLT